MNQINQINQINQNFLIVTPKFGLCNQLLAISKGIIYGLITKRDVIFHSFQLDYRSENNTCIFSDVIDIQHLEKNLYNYNNEYIIKIYSNKDCIGTKIDKSTNDDISLIKDFMPLLTNEKSKNEKYLDIGNPISSEIPYQYYYLFKYININIKFTDKYIDIAHNIKNNINLTNYICIHIRLEDDALNFMKKQTKHDIIYINNIYIKKYIDELNILVHKYPNKKIYVCTSLNIDNNINNIFYNEIKKKYNLIDKNNFIDKSNMCRELYAILDYIIAKECDYFIGCDWSSFSTFINDYCESKEIPTKLIDIWKTTINL